MQTKKRTVNSKIAMLFAKRFVAICSDTLIPLFFKTLAIASFILLDFLLSFLPLS